MTDKGRVVKCPQCGCTTQQAEYEGGKHQDILVGYEPTEDSTIHGTPIFSHTEVTDTGDLAGIFCCQCHKRLAGPGIDATDADSVDEWYRKNSVEDCEAK